MSQFRYLEVVTNHNYLKERLMLVESLIGKTIETQGFRVISVNGGTDQLIATLIPDRRFKPRCGVCGQPGKYRDQRRVRRFRHVPLWGIPCSIDYAPRRVSCDRCGGVHVEDLPWVMGKRRFTKALLHTIATWTRILSWEEVRRLFQCSWSTVHLSVKEMVEYGLANRDLSHITHIGIDEISRRKGHVYVTNVYDLNSKRLIWSGEGRKQETLREFFDEFGEEHTRNLEGICCDMWQQYIDVIKEKAPQAILVFDKFHIVRHLMEAVDEVRREEIRDKGQDHRDLVKRTRYIWLKNPWNLTDNQTQTLRMLEKLNLRIGRAYMLKEAFREFWNYHTKGWALRYLNQWFWWATHSRLQPMREFAWMIRRHQNDILNYFRMPIDNGTVEGLNNKAKLIVHKAYGFRTAKVYILNLYHCMGELPMPKMLHTFA